jgi:hypothetical protein
MTTPATTRSLFQPFAPPPPAAALRVAATPELFRLLVRRLRL